MVSNQFFEQARLALSEGCALEFPPDAILQIAADPLEEAEFGRLARQVNDRELNALIRVYLGRLAEAERRRASRASENSDSIKFALGGGAALSTLTGVAMIVSGGAALAPLVAIGCGAAIIGIGTGGSRFFKSKERKSADAKADIERLISYVKRD